MPLILFDGSVGDSRNGRNGSTSSDFLCRKFQFEKMPFKKGFKYFDFLFTAYIFAYFLVWTFPTKVWTFPTKVWTFPTKKCPQPTATRGFSAAKGYKRLQKVLITLYSLLFQKTGFFKKKQKIKNQNKTIFRIPCLGRSKPA